MEITEEDLELNSNEYDTNSNKKTLNIVISEVNDVLFINSSQNSNINMKNNEKNKSDNYESIKEIEPIIIDIPKLIWNKDAKSIQMLTLQ